MTAARTGRLTSRPRSDADAVAVEPGIVEVAGVPGALLLVPTRRVAPPPLVVFFHGAGGSARNSLPVVQDVAERRGALVLATSSRGSTWDLLTGALGPDVAALDAALGQVFSTHPVAHVAFGGFSDGGSYALSVALANGDLAGAVLAFSPGFVAPPAQVGQPRVWVAHGTADRVLPVDRCGRRVVALLDGAGYEVQYEEFDGGHVVPPGLVTAAFAWWLG